MTDAGVDYVKVGLFDSKPSIQFIKTISEAAKNTNLVIVLFAENYSGVELIEPLFQSGIVGCMLDTRNKTGKNLRSVLSEAKLREFVETAKSYNLLTGLAGSLRFEDIQTLLGLKPDYLGFRGALCSENDRIKKIDIEQVKKIRAAVPISKFINYGDKQCIEASI